MDFGVVQVLESSSRPGVVLPDDRGLAHVVSEGLRGGADRVALSRKTGSEWRDVSFATLDADIRRVGVRMLRGGIAAGDRVAIMGRTGYEWVVADFAALSVGAITVPVYPTSSPAQVAHILGDSGAVWCFLETEEHRAVFDAATDGVEVTPWGFGDLGTWLDEEVTETEAAEFAARGAAVRADDLATIVYTSGTTGAPKGCMLTHRNMFASSANTVEHLPEVFADDADGPVSTLLGLPLSHIFGRTMLISCLYAGIRTGLLPGIPDVLGEFRSFRPTFLALVPYALEKIRKRTREPGFAETVVDPNAERTAIEVGNAVAERKPLDDDMRERYEALDESVYSSVREGFGGRFRWVISGGASLDDTTWAFFSGIGVHILGAFGLTEAATAVTINQPGDNRVGSVGVPIPGTTVAIAEDGEVLVAGRNVAPGYWAGAAEGGATAGYPHTGQWLHTGDLGRIDEDGYLWITGRRKEILVTSSGKNVSPTPLEDRVRLHPLVSNCMVIGDERPFVTALITVDDAAVQRWRSSGAGDDDAALHGELATAVADANTLVSRAESIRGFAVLEGDFTLAGGHLTPSMKLRRKVIEQEFATEISGMYP